MKIAALLAVTLVACTATTTKTPDEPPFVVYPPVLDKADSCAAACQRLREIGCPEGDGSLGGQTCQSVCISASQLRSLPLACWALASTQVEAKSCGSLRCIR